MNLKILTLILIGFLLISVVSASMIIPSSDRAKERAKAPEKSPVITENTAGEWGLEQVDFTSYVKPNKP